MNHSTVPETINPSLPSRYRVVLDWTVVRDSDDYKEWAIIRRSAETHKKLRTVATFVMTNYSDGWILRVVRGETEKIVGSDLSEFEALKQCSLMFSKFARTGRF